MNAVSTASVPKHRQCPKCRLTSIETEFYEEHARIKEARK